VFGRQAELLEELPAGGVDAGGPHQEVVGPGAVREEHPGSPLVPVDLADAGRYHLSPEVLGEGLQVAIQTAPLHLFDVPGPATPVDGGDLLLVQRGVDPNAVGIGVEFVGVDSPLDDAGREVDALDSECLDQSLGDDAPAHVATGRARLGEIAGLVDVDGQVEIHPVGEAQEELGEERPRRAAPNDANSRAIL
jgi:hypothetical protein